CVKWALHSYGYNYW
nr:immunoglobulin heavy chain junction region [Macaca mulatta]MOV49971.1 immunoglobulin heavy chain junction region [Macaca mulatta]MOV50130.1 immunoglobulin heavy chain junction region [Macaca mulatta]MOV50214.1 immunoglobulin heavy chain junction region [Macaca mulatta]MOV50378.1 immunoglobulin heavy chain junction region [Macaca mulatta]